MYSSLKRDMISLRVVNDPGRERPGAPEPNRRPVEGQKKVTNPLFQLFSSFSGGGIHRSTVKNSGRWILPFLLTLMCRRTYLF